MASGFARELWRRRVPQIAGAYLAASWALIEAASWIVNRFVLSPHLVDFVGLLLLLLIPSVLLIGFQHGAPGRDRWTRVEKIGVPANLVLAAAVLGAVFGGKDLGAATTTVVVQDEEGTTLQRTVPKSEFRRRIAVFPFDNESGDPELDWLQYGIPVGVAFDLRQDLFLRTFDEPYERLRERGYPEGTDVPLPLKLEIARERYQGHVLTGTIAGSADELTVSASLYSAPSGNLIEAHTYTGGDPYALIDSLTVQLRRDLEIPSQHLKDTPDLPVGELTTASAAAFRAFVAGYRAIAVDQDWQTAGRHLEAAVTEDPSFAYAQFLLYAVSLLGNRTERAFEAVQAAMDHSYRLPERDQYTVKTEYYQSVRQDTEKALAVAEMRAELFPDDIEAHQIRAIYYRLKNQNQRAIAVIDQILELDPSLHDFIQAAGGLAQATGDFERALDYYARYAELYPDNPDSFLLLSSLNRSLGQHEEARAQVERALLIDPENGDALRQRARLDVDRGDFEAAAAGYAAALDVATTPEQRIGAYEGLSAFYELRGQLARAIEVQLQRIAELERVRPEFVALLEKIFALDLWVVAGRGEEALDSLAAIRARLSPPYDRQAARGAMAVYRELRGADGLERAILDLEAYMETMEVEIFLPDIVHHRGHLLELRENCEAAIEAYREAFALAPTEYSRHVDIGRCQRKLGRLDEADASLREALRIRASHPVAHYELALVRDALGDRAGAVEHLRSALAAWSEADPAFERAVAARAKLAELEES